MKNYIKKFIEDNNLNPTDTFKIILDNEIQVGNLWFNQYYDLYHGDSKTNKYLPKLLKGESIIKKDIEYEKISLEKALRLLSNDIIVYTKEKGSYYSLILESDNSMLTGEEILIISAYTVNKYKQDHFNIEVDELIDYEYFIKVERD